MSFTSAGFLLFVFASLLIYYIVPRRMQWIVLLAASLIFYLSAGYSIALYLLFTTASTYLTGLMLGKVDQKHKKALSQMTKPIAAEEKKRMSALAKRSKRLIVAVALIANFGILFFLKYSDFVLQNIGTLFAALSIRTALPRLDIILPLGISFYMFQSIGYVIDVYRGKYPAERNAARFALFVSFFPQIVQGPISRYDQLGPQLYAERSLDWDKLKYGLQLAFWGYFKKMLIADRAAVIVNQVFDHYTEYGGAIIIVGVLFYTIQIYCDFAGGIDITRGVAQMFGINLIENFRRPYFALSLSDFWRRWHISLSAWMKDYLFYPISLSKPFARLGRWARKTLPGNLGKILPTSLATFLVFFAIGIWHGASWKYIAFGLWNGFWITLSLILAPFYARVKEQLHIRDENKLWIAFQLLRTLAMICIGRYFTRAATLMTALRMMKRTVQHVQIGQLFDGTILKLGLEPFDIAVIVACFAIVVAIGFLQERGLQIRLSLEKRSALIQWVVTFAAICALLFLGVYRQGYISAEFIYMQF